MPEPIEKRFWAKVRKGEPDECWEWQACRQEFGHGLLRIPGKVEKAHRVSWTLANGPIPDGLIVRHKCDNPPCVNPAHLELGTRADNVRDRDGRGRHVAFHGVNHPMARLTEDAVREIRRTPRGYGVCRGLAEKFGVALGTVYQLRNAASRTWPGVS